MSYYFLEYENDMKKIRILYRNEMKFHALNEINYYGQISVNKDRGSVKHQYVKLQKSIYLQTEQKQRGLRNK